jgi:hypothetical protein
MPRAFLHHPQQQSLPADPGIEDDSSRRSRAWILLEGFQ